VTVTIPAIRTASASRVTIPKASIAPGHIRTAARVTRATCGVLANMPKRRVTRDTCDGESNTRASRDTCDGESNTRVSRDTYDGESNTRASRDTCDGESNTRVTWTPAPGMGRG
jgi:hypothetical protein